MFNAVNRRTIELRSYTYGMQKQGLKSDGEDLRTYHFWVMTEKSIIDFDDRKLGTDFTDRPTQEDLKCD